MELNKLYKHKRTLDCAFGPTSIAETETGLDVQGHWYNVSTSNITLLELDRISISNEELPNWEVYDT